MGEFSVFRLVAQLFGACGMAFLFLSYQQTQRKRLIACKLGADVMWVIHYLCLSAFGGAIPNFVGIFRELIFMQSEKKWAKSPVWPVLFILINWALTSLAQRIERQLRAGRARRNIVAKVPEMPDQGLDTKDNVNVDWHDPDYVEIRNPGQ